MRKLLLLTLVTAVSAFAGPLDSFSNADTVKALKDALTQSASTAVAALGVDDGFLKNPKVKIPLPENLQKVERVMRTFGMGEQADQLVVAMNRAAEAAVPEAKALLIEAVQKMSVADAKQILTGSDNAATQYFRKVTEAPLTKKFLPIVSEATQKVGLAQQYNQFAASGARFGLVKEEEAKIENYVTRKALDGLYLVIGEQEKALRENPVQASTSIAKKVFDALK